MITRVLYRVYSQVNSIEGHEVPMVYVAFYLICGAQCWSFVVWFSAAGSCKWVMLRASSETSMVNAVADSLQQPNEQSCEPEQKIKWIEVYKKNHSTIQKKRQQRLKTKIAWKDVTVITHGVTSLNFTVWVKTMAVFSGSEIITD